jgi:hypothetical protein
MSDKSFTGLQLPNIGSGQARNADSGFARLYFKNDDLYAVLPDGTDVQLSGISIDGLSDVVLTSPASGEVLKYNGTNWVNDSDNAGGGTPGGANTQIQFNSSGSFAGSSDLTWNGSLLSTNGLFTTGGASFTGEVFFIDDASFLAGSTTRNVFNTTATTINAFGAATTLTMGATTGTTTIRNDLSVTGNVSLSADPTTSLQAATKQYVDTIAAAGLHYHSPVRVERPNTDGNLNSTYNNGSSGVGATLTNAGTQEALVIDGITLNTNDRVLIYNQTNGYENGVYTVTNTGSGSTNWVLTRATDADSYSPSDPDSLGQGDAFFVTEGNTGAGELYVMNTSGTITFGTTDITFTEVAATAVYQAGTGLTLNGVTFSTNQDISTTASPTFVNLTATGNIIVTGTVDGRNVATDGTKLDGIEAGAQVNVGTDLGNTASGTAFTITSSTGNNTNLPAATTSAWGVMTDEDKTKLDGIESGAQVNVGTNLGNTATGTSFTITSSTGNNTNLPAATTSAWGVMTDEDKTKLDGIEASADVTDAGNVNPLVDAHLNTSTATTNQVLSWTGSDYDWVDQSGGGGALNDLTDVAITSPSSGQVLKYNGTNWVNGTDNEGAGGGGITTGKAIAMAIVFG